MTRTCTVCQHAERAAIDAALVAGAPYRNIAQQFDVGYTAVARHKEHIGAAIVASQEAREEAHALDVVKQLKTINATTVAILAEARQQKDPEIALKAIDRIQRQIELQAKLLGDLDDRPQVNVLVLPEWVALRSAILAALIAYPDARDAVADAVARLRGMQGQGVTDAEPVR
jgi:hypothetical protein